MIGHFECEVYIYNRLVYLYLFEDYSIYLPVPGVLVTGTGILVADVGAISIKNDRLVI